MTTITELDKINDCLEGYFGAYAKIWAFVLTHKKLLIRLSISGRNEILYLMAIGCEDIKGRFAWENAHLRVLQEKVPSDSVTETKIFDQNSSFELKTTGGIVLVIGSESELDTIF